MKTFRLVLGLVCFAFATVIGLYLFHARVFIHPEYTTQMMTWAYWREGAAATAAVIAGTWCLREQL